MIIRSLAAAAVLLAAFPAFGQGAPESTTSAGGLAGPTAPAATVTRHAKYDQNRKIVCKITSETGTRLMGNRICLPESVWVERDELTRQTIDNANTHVH